MASPHAQLSDPPSPLSPLFVALGMRGAAPQSIAARAMVLAAGLYAIRYVLGGIVTTLAAVALAKLFLAARDDSKKTGELSDSGVGS